MDEPPVDAPPREVPPDPNREEEIRKLEQQIASGPWTFIRRSLLNFLGILVVLPLILYLAAGPDLSSPLDMVGVALGNIAILTIGITIVSFVAWRRLPKNLQQERTRTGTASRHSAEGPFVRILGYFLMLSPVALRRLFTAGGRHTTALLLMLFIMGVVLTGWSFVLIGREHRRRFSGWALRLHTLAEILWFVVFLVVACGIAGFVGWMSHGLPLE